MSTITYKTAGIDVRVYLDNVRVGTIRRNSAGWAYTPKGSRKAGEPNHSLDAVKRSLEN